VSPDPATDPLDLRLLALDVDGVLTDGGIIIHDDGAESKQFHVHDGAWLRIWRRQGLQTALITGRRCPAARHRAADLEIDFFYDHAPEKLPAFEKLLADSNLTARQIAYVGDDVFDLPILRRAGFSAAPADAAPEIKQIVDFVTTRPGGRGAVAELIRHLLRQLNLYDQALQKYLL